MSEKKYEAVLPLKKMPKSCGECKFVQCDRIGKVNIFNCQELVSGSGIDREDLYAKRKDNCPLIYAGAKE